MTQTRKIPLFIAILVSINIVIGGGFFLSASKIAKSSGLLAPLTWILCGLLLLPLVKVLAHLSGRYPTAGGIYVYSRENLGEFWGFVSGWCYFVGTLAGNAMILHAFSSTVAQLGLPLPFASFFSPQVSQFLLDLIFIAIFTVINLFNIAIFEKMNIAFTILKTIPIGLVLVAMFFFFDKKNLLAAQVQPLGLLESMPTVLFAYLGIEACCSIAHQIKDGQKNAARAMLISLGVIVAIYSIVQFGILGILGTQTTNPFFEIIPHITQNPFAIKWGNLVIKLAILSSFLGGFYGMYYANSWNLYALAKERKLLFAGSLTKLNKYNTPWVSILVQGGIVVFLLFLAFNSFTSLMTMSGFGVVIAYILSAITYFYAGPPEKTSRILIGTLALVGCAALLILCIHDLASDGIAYLLPFIGILFSGLVLYKASGK